MQILKPQKGKQEQFVGCHADICIYGGAAGGGKTYGLLLSPLQFKNVPGFGCVVFRRNANQIFSEGGLWDTAQNMYSGIRGARARAVRSQWTFSDKGKVVSRVTFAHIERDADVLKWQGSQICELCFDELTHFSEYVFFYMLSRNRSACGVRPFVRATCNPDADSWVARFISWWIDEKTGYPLEERSGKLRWMIRRQDTIYWADSKEELIEQFQLKTEEECAQPKSVTFISSSVYDNQILLQKDPSYLSNLQALAIVEQERLLFGNWKIKPASGLYFKRTQVELVAVIPDDVIRWVRGWDLAATDEREGGDPACTAGVLMGKRKNGSFIIADVVNVRLNASDVRKTIKNTAIKDKALHKRVRTRIPQDPGQAGKDQAQSYIRYLSGFDVIARLESGSKETRAEPVAAQWQAGNIQVLIASWNEPYFSQMESFPESKLKDMVDATSSAFNELESASVFNLDALIS